MSATLFELTKSEFYLVSIKYRTASKKEKKKRKKRGGKREEEEERKREEEKREEGEFMKVGLIRRP